MGQNRLWLVGAIAGMLGILGGGWLVGISPELAAVASANHDRANVVVQNQVNEALLAKLRNDYLNIDQLKGQLDLLQAAVPSSAQISTFVTELNSLAAMHEVTVKAIAVSDAKPYSAAPPTTPEAGATSKPLVMTNPKITATNFVVIPVQFTVTGIFTNVLNFIHDVQVGQRLLLVSTISSTSSSISPAGIGSVKKSGSDGSATVDTTIGGFMYVLLDGTSPAATNSGG